MIAALVFTPLPLGGGRTGAETDAREEYSVSAGDPYMQLAIEEAPDGIASGDGGPFGSVIVKDGKVVGSGRDACLELFAVYAEGEHIIY